MNCERSGRLDDAVACQQGPEQEIDRIKIRLLDQLLGQDTPTELRLRFSRAASEAAALARTTPFPLLVFPLLLEERADVARSNARREDGRTA